MIIISNDTIPTPTPDTILVVEPSIRNPPVIGRLANGHYYRSTDQFKRPVWKSLNVLDGDASQADLDALALLVATNTTNIAINLELINGLQQSKLDKCESIGLTLALS